MSRLDATFAALRAAKRTGLVAYVTAGDPDLERSAEVIRAVDRGGADVIELGVPFSDPLADGPVIQRATERALAAGVTLARVLDLLDSKEMVVVGLKGFGTLGERRSAKGTDASQGGILWLGIEVSTRGFHSPVHRSEDTVSTLFRHTTNALVRRYAHLSPSHLHSAVETVAVFGKETLKVEQITRGTVTEAGKIKGEPEKKAKEAVEKVGAGDGI
jgi:hypothetical protein